MQSSPPNADGKARAIRELSRSLSHSPRNIPSVSPPPSDSNPTQQFLTNTLDWNDDELMMSTQHRIDDEDTNTLPQRPHIRSTAKKVGTWQMLRSEGPRIDTSMVNKEFGGFDHSNSDEEDRSVEIARGGHRSHRSTPAKTRSSLGFNSLYDITPESKRPRKSLAAETGSLRRDAQIRRASRNDVDTASPRYASTRNSPATINPERKRTSLAQLHAKVSEDDSSFMEERPSTVTLQAKTTRWGGPRSRQSSAQVDGNIETPARASNTPRPMTAQTATAQSFMLPDLPNLTELVSGVFQDGTPVFSRTAPPRSRFAVPSNPARAENRQPNHIPVDSVPIPDEEKAIFASLQLLKEKVAQLEQERAEAEKKIEEQEMEIIELKSANEAQDRIRRSDSALGSTDGEGSGRNSWKVEKTRLEASVQTLRTKLDRSERKLSIAEIATKRVTSERDNMASQLGVAFQNFEEIKAEKEALRTENDSLRHEIDALRSENDDLRNQLEQDQAQYRDETLQLRRQVDRTDTAAQNENRNLHAELARVRAQNDEHTQNLARREVELRKARKEQAEYAKLKADNDALRSKVETLKARREEEIRRWSSREAELKGKICRRDDTIRQFQDMTQEQTNEAVRLDNEHLRHELAELTAQHKDEARRWAQKEDRLRRKIEKREDAVREMEDMTREVLHIRNVNDGRVGVATDRENAYNEFGNVRQKSSQRPEDTRTRIASRVQQEVRNSRAVSASQPLQYAERNPQKTSKRIPSASHRISLPAEPSRSVSAPMTNFKNVQVDSDVESTTDLSLAPHGTPYVMRSARQVVPSVVSVQPPPDLDNTELSLIDGDVIAQIRRTLEEERVAARKNASTSEHDRRPREDTVRSTMSAKSSHQQPLPRKSSMKDVTATVFEDLTRQAAATADPTETKQSVADASILSNTSRRRRSAPAEMTSAFIVPDITMHTRKEKPAKIDLSQKLDIHAHDNDNCTVCRRAAADPSADPLHVPKLVPVSSRIPDDIDATLRPARSPKEALALVVKELLDERTHLHLEIAAHQALLAAHDVSLGMKKRTAIDQAIQDLQQQLRVKDAQIYNLYDVLEGQNSDDITEQDVEDLTREIRIEAEKAAGDKKGKEKKVTIQSYIESEDDSEDGGHLSGVDDEELPWEGFEDTASQSIKLTGLHTRRESVY